MAIKRTDGEQQCATTASMRAVQVTMDKDHHCQIPVESQPRVLSETVSELNNVLHIIGGTADVLEEHMWPKHTNPVRVALFFHR